MDIEKTFIEDLIILTPSVFEDTRGSFFESFNSNVFGNYRASGHHAAAM